MGCIEGRVAVEYFNDMQNKIQAQRLGANAPKTTVKNFVFKCHRDGNNIFSVNSIDFHHYNTFCTAGGWVDGCIGIVVVVVVVVVDLLYCCIVMC